MRPSNDLIRRMAAAALFALLLFGSWHVARNEAVAARSPKWRSDAALQKSVTDNMTPRQLRAFARQTAQTDPMHAVGFFLQVMALDLEKAPMSAKHRQLIAEASRRQPAFSAPRIWLTADDIRKGRYAEAINGADTVMRLNSEFRQLLVPILVPLLDNAKAAPLLRKKLGSFPIWRTDFVVAAIKDGGHAGNVERMLAERPPAAYAKAMAAERSAYLQKLVSDGEAERAHRLWRTFPDQSAKSGIFDGQFTAKEVIYPFAWRYATDDYSYSEKVPAVEGRAAMVRAHHSGSGRAILLSQLVGLQPGSRVLTFSMRDGGLAKPEKLFWRLRCNGSTENLASQSLGKLGGDWQRLQLRVEIPASGCALQTLVLEADDNDGDEAEVEIRNVEAS
jgi:hypothetical protein